MATDGAHAQRLTPAVTPPPTVSRYIRFHGREILRVTGFLRGTVIKCPEGHIINRRAVHFEDGLVFCDQRPQRGHAECGALIYVLTIPARGDRAHRVWLADCTREEWREIERLGLDADGVLAYFGASFAR